MTYLGEPVRDAEGRFSSMTKWIQKTLRRSALICLLGWFGFGMYQFGQFDQNRTLVAHADTVPVITADMKGKTVDQLEDELIASLAKAENEGGLPAYLDQNSHGTLSKKDALSYGCMAFKLSTVQRHYKAIHGKDIGDLEAALMALDCPQAKALAKEAIFGKLNAIGEWMAASDKMKMKVSIIREMMK